jgi:hypothetical protein
MLCFNLVQFMDVVLLLVKFIKRGPKQIRNRLSFIYITRKLRVLSAWSEGPLDSRVNESTAPHAR